MIIRRMTLDDVAAAVQIEKACFSQPWSEKSFCDSISRKDTIFLVCDMADFTNEISHIGTTDEKNADVFLSKAVALGQTTEKPLAQVPPAAPKIAGYIGMYVSFDEAGITNVAVSPEYRRQGIGRQLVTSAKAAAKNAAVNTMFLEVRVSNAPAISLYRKMGFENLGIRKNFYDHPAEDAYIMSCDLTAVSTWLNSYNKFNKLRKLDLKC